MDSVPQLLGFTSAIGDHEKRKLIEDIVEAFIQEVVPKKNRFQKGRYASFSVKKYVSLCTSLIRPISDPLNAINNYRQTDNCKMRVQRQRL